MPNEPQNTSKIVGSKWTAIELEKRRKHWQVVEYRKKDESAVLEAVIDGYRTEVHWRRLRDRDKWLPGWL
ncbi:MAG: TIGR02450 family Trp-rich protein [Myxococcota bacterium]